MQPRYCLTLEDCWVPSPSNTTWRQLHLASTHGHVFLWPRCSSYRRPFSFAYCPEWHNSINLYVCVTSMLGCWPFIMISIDSINIQLDNFCCGYASRNLCFFATVTSFCLNYLDNHNLSHVQIGSFLNPQYWFMRVLVTETLFCRYFVATCSWIVTATSVQHSVSLVEFKKDRIYQ